MRLGFALACLFVLVCCSFAQNNDLSAQSSSPVSAELVSSGPISEDTPKEQTVTEVEATSPTPAVQNDGPEDFDAVNQTDDTPHDDFLGEFTMPFGPSRVPAPLPETLAQLSNLPAFFNNLKPIHSMTFEMALPPLRGQNPMFMRPDSRLQNGLFGGLLSALQSMPPIPASRQPIFTPNHQPLFHPFHLFAIPPPHHVQMPFTSIVEMPSRPFVPLNLAPHLPVLEEMHSPQEMRTPQEMIETVMEQLMSQVSGLVKKEQSSEKQNEKQAEKGIDTKQPMLMSMTTRDNFFVVTGYFPGLTQATLHAKLDGANFIVTGQLVDKSSETVRELGELGDVDEVEETMELPYAPDAHLFKIHFDDDTHMLTAVFPKQQTTELSFS